MKNSALIVYAILFLLLLAMPVIGENLNEENESLRNQSSGILLFSGEEASNNKLPPFSNQPVLYERGPEWNDYINPDGSHTRKIYTGLKNYKNGNRYEPIDTTIIEDNGAFKVEKGAYKVHWSNSKTFKFTKDNYYFTYQGNKISQGKSKHDLGSFREVKGQKDKNRLNFKDIAPSIDVEYIYYPNLLKENIVLKKAPDMPDDMNDTMDFSGFVKYSDELDIWANGEKQVDSFSTSGAIEFRSEDRVEFFLPPPVIEDANNSIVTGEYEFVREKGRNHLFVKVPIEWLMNSSTEYPVIIDPSVASIGVSQDTFVCELHDDTRFGSETYLEVRSMKSANRRTLLKFNLGEINLPSNADISYAYLKMYADEAHLNRIIDVYYTSDDSWASDSVTWNTRPMYNYKISSISSGTAWKTWNVKSAVESDLGGTLSLIIKDHSENNNWNGVPQNKNTKYRSMNFGNNNPRLDVYYTVPDITPPPAPVISSSTHQVQDYWYSNNDLSFTWTTPYDESGIAGYSYSFDHASSTTPDKTADTTGNYKDYSNQADGTWYFHVRAKDNAGNWGNTGHYRVKIDGTPPSISISTPVDNAVLTSKDVSVYWSGSDSGSGIDYYKIKLDNGDWISKGTNTNHVFNNVDGGTHNVYVKAADNAENLHTENVDFTIQQSLPDLSISSSDITFIKVGGN